MKAINKFITQSHFRMDNLATILPTLRNQDLAVSIDLQDAYFHIPMHVSARNLLGFQFGGKTYRYKALPFGLRPAPRVFTRVIGTLMSYLRGRGLRIFSYLDDWILVANSEDRLKDHLELLIFLFVRI